METNNRLLDDWISSYVDYTDDTEPPKLYRKWVAISCMAAALERKVWMDWGKGMIWYPNFYICLVGPSGKARKSTAMRAGEEILKELDVKIASESITREALIREFMESHRIDTREDGTSIPHSSLTIFSKELTVFIGDHNKEMLMDLTDWYDCADHWVYRTKTQGTDEITGVWLNLLGATTPSSIRSALPDDAIGGGFTSRMVFVYQSRKGKTVYFPWKQEEDEEMRKRLVHDLQEVHKMIGEYKITDDCAAFWKPWYDDIEENPPVDHPKFAGYNQRRPSHTMKLAMIMAAARRDKRVVTDEDFKKADILLSETEKKMPKTFFGMGEGESANVVWKIMKYIAEKKSTKMAELMRRFGHDVDDKDHLRNILDSIAAREFVTLRTRSKSAGTDLEIEINEDSEDYQQMFTDNEQVHNDSGHEENRQHLAS